MVKKASFPRIDPRRVALAFPSFFAHLHTVVRGIAAYAREHGDWVLTTSGEAHDLPLHAIKRWRGDGVICLPKNEKEAIVAQHLKIPAVTFIGMLKDPGIPRVTMDHSKIGHLAAQHLLSRGFKRFAYYGVEGAHYSTARAAAFVSTLAREQLSVDHHDSPSMSGNKAPWGDEIPNLCRWLCSLSTPVGIFAANDARARVIADACRLAHLEVPRDVAIVGVDNNLLECEFGSPMLTSIECDWWQLGFETAKLLDALMRGTPPPTLEQLIPPAGIVMRESTDIRIVDHPAVAKAMNFVQQNLDKCFGVKAIVSEVGISRRHLEHSFLRSIHQTPAEYLAQARVGRAKHLLRKSSESLSLISKECGFSDVRQFRRVFYRLEHISPNQYRKLDKEQWADKRGRPLGGPQSRA